MKRKVFIRRAGVGKEGKPWAQGTIDLSAEERIAAHAVATSRPNIIPLSGSRVSGILNGIPDVALAALKPGDILEPVEGEENPGDLNVRVHVGDPFTREGEDTESRGLDFAIELTGVWAKGKRPEATCRW